MPYYREPLLSIWPGHIVSNAGQPPPKIDPTVLATLIPLDFGAYAQHLRKTKRYQVEDTRNSGKNSIPIKAPKFLSERAREIGSSSTENKSNDIMDSSGDLNGSRSLKPGVPPMYSFVEIKYSRFGVDDFDFVQVI